MSSRKHNKLGDNNHKNYLLKIIIIRKIANFWHNLLKPIINKTLIILLLTAILIPIFIYIFWPKTFYYYHNYLANKINDSFANYLNIESNNLQPRIDIIINGNNRVAKEELISLTNEIIAEYQKSQKLINYSKENKEQNDNLTNLIAKKIKNHSKWIDNVVVKRFLPYKFIIDISEYEPFVIWQNEGRDYVVNKDGHMIEVDLTKENFDSMIILSGDKAYNNISSLFNIFVIDPELSSKIYSATWIGDRRWNIRFENGLLIKLPEDNIDKAWQRLIKILSQKDVFDKLQMIDLRISDKTYLETL